MIAQYRLIHHGWMAMAAALAVALAPGLTRPSAAGEPAAGGAKQQVNIDNFSFMPKTLTVAVGTTVTWTNHDDVPHTVVSTKKVFASPALDTDQWFSFRFTAPGTYPYFCSVHPMMTGTVVVK
jgi:plastocyanin